MCQNTIEFIQAVVTDHQLAFPFRIGLYSDRGANTIGKVLFKDDEIGIATPGLNFSVWMTGFGKQFLHHLLSRAHGKAMIDDMAWLANAWTGMRRTSSIDPNRDLPHLTKKKETPLRRFGTNISAVSGLGCTPPRNLSEHGCARAEHDAIGSTTSEDNGAKDQVAGCQ